MDAHGLVEVVELDPSFIISSADPVVLGLVSESVGGVVFVRLKRDSVVVVVRHRAVEITFQLSLCWQVLFCVKHRRGTLSCLHEIWPS